MSVEHDQLEVLRLKHKDWLKSEWSTIIQRFPNLPYYVPACVENLIGVLRGMTKHFRFTVRMKKNKIHGQHYLLDFSEMKKICKQP